MASNQNRFEALSPANNDGQRRQSGKKKSGSNKVTEEAAQPLLDRKYPETSPVCSMSNFCCLLWRD